MFFISYYLFESLLLRCFDCLQSSISIIVVFVVHRLFVCFFNQNWNCRSLQCVNRLIMFQIVCFGAVFMSSITRWLIFWTLCGWNPFGGIQDVYDCPLNKNINGKVLVLGFHARFDVYETIAITYDVSFSIWSTFRKSNIMGWCFQLCKFTW